MRKSNREIKSIDEIIDVIRRCDVCRIAMQDQDGYPYMVPLNFGLEVEEEAIRFYFHSATEGKKLELLRQNNRVAFELDCGHTLQYFADKGYCTMAYESVMGKGTVRFLEDAEKAAALKLLMAQYHQGEEVSYNPAAIPRTTVYCLEVEEITGKRKEQK